MLRTTALALTALTLTGCAHLAGDTLTDAERHARLRAFLIEEGASPGTLEVLDTAAEGLAAMHARGEGELVTLEDLWTHARQEGQSLFDQPDRLWGITTAAETNDMIGQSTVGPWQMTTWNIRDHYGPRHGVEDDWTDAEIHAWAAEHPRAHAMMITDYIQRSYESFGVRSPYAIQRYFWLEPYVRGELGHAEDWSRSPVARPPEGGTWEDLTDAMRADTGFYAKQILLGAPYTERGLLFWLLVTGDEEAARETLRTWRDTPRLAVAEEGDPADATLEGTGYRWTDEPGGFAVSPDDVIYDTHPEIEARLRALIAEVNAER